MQRSFRAMQETNTDQGGSEGAKTARFLTQWEAAEALQISVSTLKRWRTECRGPSWFHVGNRPRYRVADLEAWAAKNRIRTRG